MSLILPQGQSALPLVLGPVVQASDGKTAMPGLLASPNGSTVTAGANGTTTTLVTASAPGASAGQAILFKTGANTSGMAWVTAVSGSGPYTTTFSPAAPNATTNGDTVFLADIGVQISKDGGSFAAPASTSFTDMGRGYYALGGNATDANTAGELLAAWDVYGSTAGVSNEKAYQVGNVPAADSPGATTLLSRISGSIAPQSGDSYARLGAPAGASVSADIAAATAVVQIIAALVGQNQGVRNQSYDSNGSLLSADICSYDTPTHAALNDGATGLSHKWSLALTYSGLQQATQSLAQVS